MVNRALMICLTYTSLAAEFDEIRRIGLMNGYTSSFIDTIIGIKLSQYRKKNNDVIQSPQTGPDKKRIYVEIPFIENAIKELKSKITHLCNKLRPDLDVQFYMKSPRAVQMLYQTKDPIDMKMKSDVVYSIKCSQCEHSYIGKTERQCIKRLHEHGAPKSSTQQQQEQHCTQTDNNIPELRRSDRLKSKTTAASPPTTTNTIVKKETTSAVEQHQYETGH
ncbi:unnamed protein product [Rotaria sp. Silwood2]|nr:unnamed protein product [Rotaria sp. Silwood2]CAF4253107.1 unnamed protein product [Rotaria sp. Silwood2]